MDNQIIIYGQNPSTGAITPINVSGTGQNATISYISNLQGASDFGTVPGTRIFGETLRYNTSTSKYDSRLPSYFCCNLSGGTGSFTAGTNYDILLNTSIGSGGGVWTRMNRNTSDNNGFTFSSSTGLTPASTTKYYKISAHLSYTSLNIGTADTVLSLLLFINNSEARRMELTYNADGSFGCSSPMEYIGTNISNIRFLLSSNFATSTPFSGTTLSTVNFSCSVIEI